MAMKKQREGKRHGIVQSCQILEAKQGRYLEDQQQDTEAKGLHPMPPAGSRTQGKLCKGRQWQTTSTSHLPSIPPAEVTTEFSKLLVDSLCPLLDQMTNINQQLTALNQNLAAQQLQLTETTKKTAEKVKEMDAKSKKVKKKVQMLKKKQASEELQLLQLQMEKANLVLRFQGVPEAKEENLKQLLSNALAPVTDLKAEYLVSEMDVIYRAYSVYIKKNNLPGEIVVRFLKRHVRDQILKATIGTPLKTEGSIIRILKHFPFEIRKKRKKYKDLILQTTTISYRWLTPEDVIFKLQDKKEKIDSVSKAREFLRLQLRESGEDGKDEEDSKHSDEMDSATSDKDSTSEKGAAAPKREYQLRIRKDKTK